MKVETKVRYSIEVSSDALTAPVAVEFASRDIGFTQGTTLGFNGVVLAQYRPGTLHWDRALDIAQDIVKQAFERVWATEWWASSLTASLADALQAVMKEQNCLPWDGNDLDGGWV